MCVLCTHMREGLFALRHIYTWNPPHMQPLHILVHLICTCVNTYMPQRPPYLAYMRHILSLCASSTSYSTPMNLSLLSSMHPYTPLCTLWTSYMPRMSLNIPPHMCPIHPRMCPLHAPKCCIYFNEYSVLKQIVLFKEKRKLLVIMYLKSNTNLSPKWCWTHYI